MRTPIAAILVAGCIATGIARSQEPVPAPDTRPEPRASDLVALEAIRGQIVALDLEGALAAIDVLLATPELSEEARSRALDLRAQAHVASDDLDAAEKDYRAILAIRPDYQPSPELMSKRAMERFALVVAGTMGTIHVVLDPPDATAVLDGRPVADAAARSFRAMAGERRLRIERRGYDATEVPVRVGAGEETLVKVALVPNARAIVVRTDVAGVTVTLDGLPTGKTAFPQGAAPDVTGPAELLIDDVAVGEHAIGLEKSCYADETLHEMVRVDMADRSPERLKVVTMRPARARVTATGATYAGELRVDGTIVAALPVETFTMCPGERNLEVVASGRVVWSGTVDAGEADLTLNLSPRPSCVLVGAEWPKGWSAAASAWSLRGQLVPTPGSDLATASGWAAVVLPPGTDVALGIAPRAGVAGEDRVLLFSPTLALVEDRPLPPAPGRPDWSVASIGATFVDSSSGVVAATVTPGGPAAVAGMAPGDRVLAAAGRKATRAAEVEAAVVAAVGSKVVFELAPPGGQDRTLEIATARAPRIDGSLDASQSVIVRAAWAAADAAAGGPEAPAALGNLALLLERASRDAPAVDAWRKLRAIAGEQPLLTARADYALGVASLAAGAAAEAASYFTRAKGEAEAAGLIGLAAAAADRLADCGIAAR